MTSSSSRDSQSVQASPSDIRAITGLTAEEVDRRIREEGPNELATTKPRTWLTIAWDVVREPMLLLLLAAGSLNFLLGEPQDGFILLSFVIVVIAITFFQERRTERALEALAGPLESAGARAA